MMANPSSRKICSKPIISKQSSAPNLLVYIFAQLQFLFVFEPIGKSRLFNRQQIYRLEVQDIRIGYQEQNAEDNTFHDKASTIGKCILYAEIGMVRKLKKTKIIRAGHVVATTFFFTD